MATNIHLNLPPHGLIVRDFILTTLAHICREAYAKLEIFPTGVNIRAESINDLAKAYIEILERGIEILERERLLSRSLYLRGGARESLSLDKFREHRELIERNPAKIREVMESLKNIEWSGPIGNRVIYIGKTPTISAPLLFKVNYYSGKRSFLSTRYRDAKIKMDQSSLLFACVGVALSHATIFPEKRTAIYVPVAEPGAIELQRILADTFIEVGGRFSPDVIFKVLIGFRIGVSGTHPLSIIAISEGKQRPVLLSYQEVSVEEGIPRFVNSLRDRSREIVISLLVFTLRNWDASDKNQRAIIRTGFELAQAIYLASMGAMKPADVMYRLARSTYATTSDEFGKALMEARNSPVRSLDAFRMMIIDVGEALDRCLAF